MSKEDDFNLFISATSTIISGANPAQVARRKGYSDSE